MRGLVLCVLGVTGALMVPGATSGALAYINGSYASPPVTAGRLCGELARAGIAAGAQREGHVLRSVSCGGGGHSFTVHLTID